MDLFQRINEFVLGKRLEALNVKDTFTLDVALQAVVRSFFEKETVEISLQGLPFSINKVPALSAIASLQERITLRVISAVATRPVVTLFELEKEICSEENIGEFGDLGLAPSLSYLSVVRNYFQLPHGKYAFGTFTMKDFISFLTNNPAGQSIVNSGGDAADFVKAFANAQRCALYYVGVHVQNFEWLIAAVRLETTRMQTIYESFTEDVSSLTSRTMPFFRQLITSVSQEVENRLSFFPNELLRVSISVPLEDILPSIAPYNMWYIDRYSNSATIVCQFVNLLPELTDNSRNSSAFIGSHDYLALNRSTTLSTYDPSFSKARNGDKILATVEIQRDETGNNEIEKNPSKITKRRRGEPILSSPTCVAKGLSKVVNVMHNQSLLPSYSRSTPSHINGISSPFLPQKTISWQMGVFWEALSSGTTLDYQNFTIFIDSVYLCIEKLMNEFSSMLIKETIGKFCFSNLLATIPQWKYLHQCFSNPYLLKYHRLLFCQDYAGSSVDGDTAVDYLSKLLLEKPDGWEAAVIPLLGWDLQDCPTLEGCCTTLSVYFPGPLLRFLMHFLPDSVRKCLKIIDIERLGISNPPFDSHSMATSEGLHPKSEVELLFELMKVTRLLNLPTSEEDQHPLTILFRELDRGCNISVSDALVLYQLMGNVFGNSPPKDIHPIFKKCKWIPSRNPFSGRVEMVTSKEVLCPESNWRDVFRSFARLAPQDIHGMPPNSLLASFGVSSLSPVWVHHFLSTVPPGFLIPCWLIRNIFSYLRDHFINYEFLEGFCDVKWIILPLWDKHLEDKSSITDDNTIEIDSLVSPNEAAWFSLNLSHQAKKYFPAGISTYLPENFHHWLSQVVGVPDFPTFHYWVIWLRSLKASESFSLTYETITLVQEITVTIFSSCPFITKTEVVEFQLSGEEIIPSLSGWHSLREMIFFLTDELVGDDERSFVSYRAEVTDFRFILWNLPKELTTRARNVFERVGFLDFRKWSFRSVICESINLQETIHMSEKVRHFVPYVQELLRTSFPETYASFYDGISERLKKLGFLISRKPYIIYTLYCGVITYTLRKPLRFKYISEQHTFCGVDEAFSPQVGAKAIYDIFFPLGCDDFKAGKAVLELLESLLSSVMIDGTQRVINFRVHQDSTNDKSWYTSASFNSKFRSHYPHGKDGLKSILNHGETVPYHHIRNEESLWENVDEDFLNELRNALTRIPPVPPIVSDRKGNIGGDLSRRETFDDSEEENSRDSVDPGRKSLTKVPEKISSHTRRGNKGRRNKTLFDKIHEQDSLCRTSVGLLVTENLDTEGYAKAAESFVYEQLIKEYGNSAEVIWVNKFKEQGTPYDIVVRRTSGTKNTQQIKDDIIRFIEVKSTATRDRKDFEFSLRELIFAARYGKMFDVARVFNATVNLCEHNMRLTMIHDLYHMWRIGKISITGGAKVLIL